MQASEMLIYNMEQIDSNTETNIVNTKFNTHAQTNVLISCPSIYSLFWNTIFNYLPVTFGKFHILFYIDIC